MAALNQEERSRTISCFITTYLITVLLFCLVFYFQFVVTPRIHNRETALTNDKIDELVRYTNDADSLVIQIQKAPVVEAKALVPFYKWTSDLKTVYKQPFYEAIITSYSDLVNEIAQAKSKDTTLPSLKNRIIVIQKANLNLMQQNRELKEQLKVGKEKKN
jgi:hypothetical protein